MPDASVSRAEPDQRRRAYHRLLAASLVARVAPVEADQSALATWVRARIGGAADAIPEGLEGDAASVLTFTADYDDTDAGRVDARNAVESFRRHQRITELDDAIALLKPQGESTEYTREQRIALAELQREKKALEAEDRRAAT